MNAIQIRPQGTYVNLEDGLLLDAQKTNTAYINTETTRSYIKEESNIIKRIA